MPVANLALNRKLTRAFIAANPVTLVLTPRTREKKPAGGWAWAEGTPRDPQTLTLIEPRTDPLPTVTVDGVERVVRFTLLGAHDSLLDTGDIFSHQGKDWEVVEMFFDNGYERRGLVTARGR